MQRNSGAILMEVVYSVSEVTTILLVNLVSPVKRY